MAELNLLDVSASTTPMNSLMVLAIILISGLIGGRAAQRLGGPSMIGNIAAGILIGPVCFNLFSGANVIAQLAPLSTFEMVFISLAMGSHLLYRRIHNSLKRITYIAIGEVLGACLLVSTVAWVWSGNIWIALLLGALAIETAPTSTLAIIRENQARGPYVKTLMAVIAIDCSLCILIFSLIEGQAAEHFSGHEFMISRMGLNLVWQLGGAMLLAIGIALCMEYVSHRWGLSELILLFLAILTVAGISDIFSVNRLLVGLVLGCVLANFSHKAEEFDRAFEPIELLLFTGFFTLAGVNLHWHNLASAGVLCLLYIAARVVGKAFGAIVGGHLSGSPARITWNMPLSLVSQSGVAIGLVIVLQNETRIPAYISESISTTILAAIVINEILGSFLTRMALRRTKEAGQDKPRLMEFLQEEFIATDMSAKDKWDAINVATEFYFRTHRCSAAQQELIRNTIIEREKSMTTAIGKGIAIPHGRLKKGKALDGVLIVLEEGVDFGAPDQESVRVLILIVTPKDHEQRHSQVLVSLASMLENDIIHQRLISARTPHDVWEVIADEGCRDFNYFLEEVQAS